MRTTIDIPDPMLRQVKAKCAIEGRSMRSLALLFFGDWLEDGPATAALFTAAAPQDATSSPRSASHAGKAGKTANLAGIPAFGMWKDRDDMADPAAWVRALRKPRFA